MTHKLNFIIPIFDQRVKVRTGDLTKLIKKYKVDVDLPAHAVYDVKKGCHLILLPEDWENYLLHETGHCAWNVVRTYGGDILHSEEEIMYIHEYLYNYIKKNL